MYGVHASLSLGRCAIAFVAGAIAATSLSLAASAEPYALVDLGVGVSPEDVNDLRVVVGSRQLAPGNTTAFLYSPEDGSIRDLEGTVARAVNRSGVVVGDTPTGAFLFDGSATLDLPDAGARGINERGVVAGYVEMENPYRRSPLPLAPALYEGTAWRILDVAKVYSRGTRQGVYADLYVLADVNESGTAVGTKSRSGLYGSSAILTPPAFDRVVYLPISGGGRAAAINDSDLVVGTTGEDSSTRTFAHAFLYDGTSVQDLGTLGGGLRSSASDINASGQVVGSSWLSTVETISDVAQLEISVRGPKRRSH
jgi:probable HAF family extracellular repeat protein